MRRWIRSHLTYANVMATLAVFLVVGGGTALAAYVVSTNSQIGPGTVSGHKPPRGDHSNIIAGSVNATDLAPAAVTGSRLANASVTAAKLNLPKISFSGPDTDANDGAPHHTLLSLDGLTLGASCVLGGGSTTTLQLYVADSSGGTLRGTYSTGLGTASPQLALALPNSTPSPFASATSSGSPTYLAGEFTYANANRVVGILLDGVTNRVADSCDAHGTVIPAPN